MSRGQKRKRARQPPGRHQGAEGGDKSWLFTITGNTKQANSNSRITGNDVQSGSRSNPEQEAQAALREVRLWLQQACDPCITPQAPLETRSWASRAQAVPGRRWQGAWSGSTHPGRPQAHSPLPSPFCLFLALSSARR